MFNGLFISVEVNKSSLFILRFGIRTRIVTAIFVMIIYLWIGEQTLYRSG